MTSARHGRFLSALLRSFEDVVVVAEAVSGTDALAAIEKERPDLALLDLQMPELDGIGRGCAC